MANRLLIAAGEPASSVHELPFGIKALIDAADEILVVTPTLPSRLDWLSSATDRAKEQADERLQTVLGHLAERGLLDQVQARFGLPVTAFSVASA